MTDRFPDPDPFESPLNFEPPNMGGPMPKPAIVWLDEQPSNELLSCAVGLVKMRPGLLVLI